MIGDTLSLCCVVSMEKDSEMQIKTSKGGVVNIRLSQYERRMLAMATDIMDTVRLMGGTAADFEALASSGEVTIKRPSRLTSASSLPLFDADVEDSEEAPVDEVPVDEESPAEPKKRKPKQA